jgi:histidinol-phosphate aminotransferase
MVLRLRAAQAHWPVNVLALEACVACSSPAAVAEARAWAVTLGTERARLADLLSALPGVQVVPSARAAFLLIRTQRAQAWIPLRGKGIAVRRGDTFPGLDDHWIRVAVRDAATSDSFRTALQEVL